MRSRIHSQHWEDDHGKPAGGNTYGKGFAIGWQNGPLGKHSECCEPGQPCNENCTRTEPNGAFVADIIAAAVDRLQYYQDSPFACTANHRAIEHLEAALDELEARTKDREARAVEGTYQA